LLLSAAIAICSFDCYARCLLRRDHRYTTVQVVEPRGPIGTILGGPLCRYAGRLAYYRQEEVSVTGQGAVLDLPIALDRAADESLQWQLIAQLRAAIFNGSLSPGTRLPATRALAQSLGISRNVVVAAYDELFAEGYIAGRHGSGTYVEATLPAQPRVLAHAPAGAYRWQQRPGPPQATAILQRDDEPGVISFRPGVPALDLLPPEVWRRAWRTATDDLPPNRYSDPAGEPALRAALARWAGQTRGVACGPDDVVITTGAAQALDLIVRATVAPGDAVAFEEPGYFAARNIILAHGARIVPVPVDSDGLRVEALPIGDAAPILACVTPSHQYPLGGRLPIARRLALLEWARTQDSLVVEDDYDSEFRFDAPPLPALLSLDREGRVVYIGTFAKSLTDLADRLYRRAARVTRPARGTEGDRRSSYFLAGATRGLSFAHRRAVGASHPSRPATLCRESGDPPRVPGPDHRSCRQPRAVTRFGCRFTCLPGVCARPGHGPDRAGGARTWRRCRPAGRLLLRPR